MLLILVAVAISFIAGNAVCACIPHERDALLAFKRGITLDPAGLLSSWQESSEDCCTWSGVRCSNRTGHVLKLHLRSEHFNVHGEPTTPMVGQISHSLLSLENLKHLDLSWNRLNRPIGHIPKFLGSLKNLKYLNLSGMPFSGVVPPHLGNLSKLHYLDLSMIGNRHTHSTDVSWVAHLRFLQYLDLSWVNLSSIADWPHVVNKIPSLRVLQLYECSLASANQSVPFLNLTSLELHLSYNYFDHPIESCWFWNIPHLKLITLWGTNLYGPFPIALEEMTSIQFFAVSAAHDPNKPKFTMATTTLRNLCNLEVLDIQHTLLSNGDITEWLESLPQCTSNKLRKLTLRHNNITGVLPNRMGQLLASLELLNLSGNNITGPLPSSVGQFTSLRTLVLSHNHLTGNVPYEIGMLGNLTELDLIFNDLDGVITEEHFAGLKSLQYIDLSFNYLKIVISSDWQPSFRLTEAYFSACQMGPLFPSWLKWMVALDALSIDDCGINDRLPNWFCSTFSKTWYMNISNNQIHGGLPASMEHMSLESLYFGSNLLTGPIPRMPITLKRLDLSRNLLSGPLL